MKKTTIERNKVIRRRADELRSEGKTVKEVFSILKNEFFLSEGSILGVLYSKKIKRGNHGV